MGRGMEQKEKMALEYGQQYGDCWVVGVIQALNGKGKIYSED